MSEPAPLFILRRAVAADAQAVKVVQEAAVRDGASGFYEPESIEAWVGAFSVANFPKRVEEMSYWVAELPDGRIGGFLSVKIETAEVNSVCTAPWARGIGLGKQLLERSEEIAREAGLERVWLDASLNAVSFYEKYGWRETKRHALVHQGVEIPVVMMEKKLGLPDSR